MLFRCSCERFCSSLALEAGAYGGLRTADQRIIATLRVPEGEQDSEVADVQRHYRLRRSGARVYLQVAQFFAAKVEHLDVLTMKRGRLTVPIT